MDQFAAIAKSGIGGDMTRLITPAPKEDNHSVTELSAPYFHSPVLPKTMDTKEELNRALNDLRTKYAPFLEDRAPNLPSFRKQFSLQAFSHCFETECTNFSDILSGKGEWNPVTLPHYGGPVGNATAFYRTVFSLPHIENDQCVYLYFGGVDYIANVYVNGRFAGSHEGFFSPFELEITSFLSAGENTLLVEVKNDYIFMGNKEEEGNTFFGDKLYAATGIGYDDPKMGWHHCPPGMGIYGEVCVEIRPKLFLSDIYVRSIPETETAECWVAVENMTYRAEEISFQIDLYGQNFDTPAISYTVSPTSVKQVGLGDSLTEAQVKQSGTFASDIPLLAKKGRNEYCIPISIPGFRKWEPDAPYLYQVQVKLLSNQKHMDAKACQFGMRSFRQDTEHSPKGMFYLNEKPIRLRGANTMGFEQLDVLRGDTEQLITDILLAKLCNMNFLRLTQRPVQEEVYTYCDRLGLMTQTDLPLFGCMRRNKFAEGVRQAEEMACIVRKHPCNIVVSYINEPFPNASNEPHRNLTRKELQSFFKACDEIVKFRHPDQVIKHVDGDYDPPDDSMPDNHCYPMWYNGHGIDIGKLHKGYWLPVKPDWYYGCGEFGVEGLDFEEVMREEYPAEWMKEPWSPASIINAQTGAFHYMFYDTKDTVKEWITASQEHQRLGVKRMTEAFRRNPDMVSFAVHLFIDAWPSGWMKSIMDVRRNPKPAYFAYRDALEPIFVNLRCDRMRYFGGETAEVAAWLCNDTDEALSGSIQYELCQKGACILQGEQKAECPSCTAAHQGTVRFTVPQVTERTEFYLRAVYGKTEYRLPFTVFPEEPIAENSDVIYAGRDMSQAEQAKDGKTVILEDLPAGTYEIAGKKIVIKPCGMLPTHFVSRNTGHPLVDGFQEKDFSYWYEETKEEIVPILKTTFVHPEITPILMSGNMDEQGEWKPAIAVGEWNYGAGKVILCQMELKNRISCEPIARIFYNRLIGRKKQ